MKQEIIIPKKEIEKLSASKLTTYFGCSLAFVFHYMLHIRVKESAQLTFGRAIHYMLKRFYDQKFKSKDSFIRYWKHYWNATIAGDFLDKREKEKINFEVEIFPVKLASGDIYELQIGSHVRFFRNPVGEFFGYKRLGARILGDCYDRFTNAQRPTFYEREFNVVFEGHKLEGVWDRIDEKDGKIFITDYKTDKASPQDRSFLLHRHPQLTLYSLAHRLEFGKEEDAVLYYHLRTNKLLKTKRGEDDFQYLLQLLNTARKRINENDFTPFYGFHCNFCDYQQPCGKYSIGVGPKVETLEDKIEILNKEVEVVDL